MEEIYVNVEYDKSVHPRSSTNQTGPRSSERRFYRAAVLCLGLLSVFLLVGLISLGVHSHSTAHGAAGELSTIKANMTELLQDSDKELSFLTAERDQLNSRVSSLTAKLSEMTKDRDRLDSLSKKTCPAGWTQFSWSCYILSSRSDSWTNGRSDCHNKGADLVIINSKEEQEFVSGFTNQSAWIGLSDRAEEGTWKWVDGSPLTFKFWDMKQPDDRNGEDCAEIDVQRGHKWNDLPCGHSLLWICEKKV
ncbi:CD209 antigen-like protein C [Channa argus]|uniref:CD209 antigen-like protein C n=1 Tax=Channa argus TaxID=215402 RepID=UPI003521EAB9